MCIRKTYLLLILILPCSLSFAQSQEDINKINARYAEKRAEAERGLSQAEAEYRDFLNQPKDDKVSSLGLGGYYQTEKMSYEYEIASWKARVSNVENERKAAIERVRKDAELAEIIARQLEENNKVEEQRRQVVAAQNRQIQEQKQQQIREIQQQREEAIREQHRREAEERERRRREEEERRRIQFKQDYMEEMTRSRPLYEKIEGINAWRASDGAVVELGETLKESRIKVSLDDVKLSSNIQLRSSSDAASRLKNKLRGGSIENNIPAGSLVADSEKVLSFLRDLDYRDAPSIDNPHLFYEWIKKKFEEKTQLSIKDLQDKDVLSANEEQAMKDFDLFAYYLLDEQRKELKSELKELDDLPAKIMTDMAILSALPYGNKEEYLQYTDYRMVVSESAPEDVKKLAKMIELCNDDTYGFHAQLYYNDITGEYTVSFEGSSVSPADIKSITSDLYNKYKQYKGDRDISFSEWYKDWYKTNKVQGLDGGVPDQFKLVNSIAAMIDSIPDVKVNLTGHSLGGGLASYCGLITGRDTYTFNAEGVNMNIIEHGGENAKKDYYSLGSYNITAYRVKGEVLTWAQEKGLAKSAAIGIPVEIDIPSKYYDSIVSATSSPTKNAISIAAAIPIRAAQKHEMDPVVLYSLDQKKELITEWKQMKELKEEYDNMIDMQKQMTSPVSSVAYQSLFN